jgi:DNA (cytosine-5)-methyltransferase 1
MKYFLDLFSGIGGFALGAYWAGLRFDGHYFSEVDNYAIRVYQQRFPDAIGLGDIRKIRGQDLPKGDWITCGGFPCQDISVAGKGVGLAGERSGLWFEYARLIGEIQPQYAIMENVGALSFRGLDAVLGSLAEIGYDAEWCDIRASDIGAPHRRERLWIVAYPHNVGMERQGAKFQTARTGRTGKDVADTSSKRLERRKETILKEERWHSCTGYDKKKIGSSWRNSQWDSEPDVGRVANGVPSRVDRLKCLGNSIVPQIAELIFSQAVFDKYRLVHEKEVDNVSE